jgi:hypothetical protein
MRQQHQPPSQADLSFSFEETWTSEVDEYESPYQIDELFDFLEYLPVEPHGSSASVIVATEPGSVIQIHHDSDVVLVSSDNVSFYVHSTTLGRAS